MGRESAQGRRMAKNKTRIRNPFRLNEWKVEWHVPMVGEPDDEVVRWPSLRLFGWSRNLRLLAISAAFDVLARLFWEVGETITAELYEFIAKELRLLPRVGTFPEDYLVLEDFPGEEYLDLAEEYRRIEELRPEVLYPQQMIAGSRIYDWATHDPHSSVLYTSLEWRFYAYEAVWFLERYLTNEPYHGRESGIHESDMISNILRSTILALVSYGVWNPSSKEIARISIERATWAYVYGGPLVFPQETIRILALAGQVWWERFKQLIPVRTPGELKGRRLIADFLF